MLPFLCCANASAGHKNKSISCLKAINFPKQIWNGLPASSIIAGLKAACNR